MSKSTSTSRVRATYDFIKAQRATYSVETLCRVLGVAPSGYYAWLKQPLSKRAQEDARLIRLIRTSFVASQGIYGAPRVFLDLREAGETCSKHRVARLMREHRLRALHGYRIRRWSVGKPAVLIPNLLQRRFTVTRPNRAWVTDITYIRTWQGWLYLAVVMDLFSRKIVGWAARPTIHRELVLDAVLMAVRARRPRRALIHARTPCPAAARRGPRNSREPRSPESCAPTPRAQARRGRRERARHERLGEPAQLRNPARGEHRAKGLTRPRLRGGPPDRTARRLISRPLGASLCSSLSGIDREGTKLS